MRWSKIGWSDGGIEGYMRFELWSQHLGCVAVIAVTIFIQKSAIDDRSLSQFLREFQRGVARDDRPAVAALVQYPLTVFAGAVRIPISDAPTLLQNYDVVFSAALKTLISQAALTARGGSAAASTVNVTTDAATIGIDAVRIEPVGERLKITRITSIKRHAPIDSRARDGVRTWIGRIPEDGEYRIDVVRLAPAAAPRLQYVIIVSMR